MAPPHISWQPQAVPIRCKHADARALIRIATPRAEQPILRRHLVEMADGLGGIQDVVQPVMHRRLHWITTNPSRLWLIREWMA
jgi:hypothetical protein